VPADPGLLTPEQRKTLASRGCDIETLEFSLREGHLTAADAAEALSFGVDPNLVGTWVGAGRLIPDLAAAIDGARHVDPSVVGMGLLVGLTVSDLAWFESSGASWTPGALQLVILGIRFDTALADRYDSNLNPRLAQLSELQRRLALVLLARHQYSGSALLALITELGDVPWLDVLATLILDGTPVDEAIAIAQADHAVEVERNVTVMRNVGSQAAEPGRTNPGGRQSRA
jgi:hypothetical protein